MSFQITSPAFDTGAAIPPSYTCDGKDISPPLTWIEPPDRTRSIALIADDPDAPGGTCVHWVIYNIDPNLNGLKEGVAQEARLPDGALQGTNDFRRVGYGGPCPPSGTHRYFFKLYALDTMLDLSPKATKNELESAMRVHVLAHAELMGTYQRKR